MKTFVYLIVILGIQQFNVLAQHAEQIPNNSWSTWSIEPAVGFHPNFGIDVLISNLVQKDLSHFSLAAHSCYSINNTTQRSFNFIETRYNYSLIQKFGIGRTVRAKRSSHSLFLMVGAKYTAFKETLQNPALESASVSITSFSPDYGILYSMRKGKKAWFFCSRVYIPLYPWPAKGSDISYIDNNRDNIAIEFGLGRRIVRNRRG